MTFLLHQITSSRKAEMAGCSEEILEYGNREPTFSSGGGMMDADGSALEKSPPLITGFDWRTYCPRA